MPAADCVLGSQRLAKPLGKSQTVREDNALAVAPFRSRSCVSGLLAIVHFTLPVSPRWTVSRVERCAGVGYFIAERVSRGAWAPQFEVPAALRGFAIYVLVVFLGPKIAS